MIIDMHTHVYPEKIAKRAVEKLSKAADIPAVIMGNASPLHSLLNPLKISPVKRPASTLVIQVINV